MHLPNFSLQASQAKLTFLKHLQNFRGTLQCEQNRDRKDFSIRGIDPRHVATYKVCAPQQLEAKVIFGSPLLERLSQQCFNALVDYVHYTLLSQHPLLGGATAAANNSGIATNVSNPTAKGSDVEPNGLSAAAHGSGAPTNGSDVVGRGANTAAVAMSAGRGGDNVIGESCVSVAGGAKHVSDADAKSATGSSVVSAHGDGSKMVGRTDAERAQRAVAASAGRANLERAGAGNFTDALGVACASEKLDERKRLEDITLNVGMSGGADSTLVLVLACALRDKYGYKVKAIHCIHGLDPDDDIWLQHNQQLSLRLRVALLTPVLHIQYGAGVSPEEISRKERYRALLELTRKGQDCLLLGHQADDQVENFLIALKRGSGPQGLAGMRLMTQDERGILVRPLLDLHKLEIEQILSDLGYGYVYDLSNGYLKFERNYMRLKVMPVLRQRFAGMDKSILRSQRLCGFEHDLAMRLVAEKLPQQLKVVTYPPYQALQLANLQDIALNISLIRAYLNLFCPNIDFNLVERCYELLLSPHDVNGSLKVGDSPYIAATFLNFLCLYVPFTFSELAAFKGQYHLKVGESLAIGSMTYTLEALGSDLGPEATLGAVGMDAQQQVQALSRGQAQSLAMSQTQAQVQDQSLSSVQVPNAQASQSGVKEDSQGYFVLSQQEVAEGVCLDFDYTQSRKLKPVTRAHSREIKKLFIEYKIAPWVRPSMPLVTTLSTGEVLALGDIFRVRPCLNGARYRLKCQRTLEN